MSAGLSQGRSQYDVIGASEGPDIGSLAPDAQSSILRALAAHLDKITAVVLSNPQAPVEQVEYEVDASNFGAGGQTYKLPTGALIVSYFIENNSGGSLMVFAGASGSGRVINAVPGAYFKVALMPQQLTSLSIVPLSLTATGLVRILLTSAVLSPDMGSTIGVVNSAPSATAAMTYVNVGSLKTLLPANPNRISSNFINVGANNVYLALGFNASLGPIELTTVLVPFVNYVPAFNWQGNVTAYSSSGTNAVVVTEYTT